MKKAEKLKQKIQSGWQEERILKSKFAKLYEKHKNYYQPMISKKIEFNESGMMKLVNYEVPLEFEKEIEIANEITPKFENRKLSINLYNAFVKDYYCVDCLDKKAFKTYSGQETLVIYCSSEKLLFKKETFFKQYNEKSIPFNIKTFVKNCNIIFLNKKQRVNKTAIKWKTIYIKIGMAKGYPLIDAFFNEKSKQIVAELYDYRTADEVMQFENITNEFKLADLQERF